VTDEHGAEPDLHRDSDQEPAERARIVVIGGGITGCSIAYHLALAGERDVLLVEKAQLTAGSTCQAMGLVTMFNPSSTMMAFRRYSIELYRSLGVFEAVGSVRIASSRDQLRELQRTLSRTLAMGLEAELVDADGVTRLMPAVSRADLFGGVWLPGDGHLDPHSATHALAAAARASGVRIRTGVRVTGIRLSERGEVRAVETTDGPIETEIVVNAAGIWAPQVCAMAGTWIPSTPVDHQHGALRAVAGAELPHDMPCFRDPDRLVYGRSEAGGLLVGGYEAEPAARWIDAVPWDHAATGLPPDYGRFAPLLAGAAERFPFLADAEVGRLVCHPDAMTPDANPLLGPMPGVRGLWVAAGLSLNGFGGAGGIGRAMAAWITTGDPETDVVAYRAWRFADTYRDPTYAAALAREAYSYYYRLRYPFDVEEAGRPRRLSALHGRLSDDGAVFAVKAGWERADRYMPGSPARRAGPDQRAWGWARPPYFDRIGEEVRAVRERAGLIDLSSFGKIAIDGPGALPLLQRALANDVDRPVGSIVYGQMLDMRGGMVADVTVTRLGPESFRLVTGAGYVASDLGWLRLNARTEDALPVTLRDVSDELACIGLWGPAARRILEATGADIGDAAIPLRRARDIRIGPATVLASRISYAGELGWELYVGREWAVQVWDRIADAGRHHGLSPFGYRALESLRLEKGYRYYGTDLTARETPDEAGLRPFVALGKGDFLGRGALLERRKAGQGQRLRTLTIGDSEFLPLYGGEAVRIRGEIVGRLRSVAFGYSIGRTVGTTYLATDLAEGSAVEVDVFDGRVAAEVAPDVLVDPTGFRMRG
jgi:glycine cleavage system aminomethyltransferase T/glycine/D-amino acid oxidase-like deaminating enzyme